jgi:TRAP-type C4-dicarboxylate transport system permease small subunit
MNTLPRGAFRPFYRPPPLSCAIDARRVFGDFHTGSDARPPGAAFRKRANPGGTPATIIRNAPVNRHSPSSLVDGFLDRSLPVIMTGVTLLVFVQVLLRYVFNAPLMGIEELLLFPTTWLYMLGAIKASSEKTQIVARVLEIFLRRRRHVYLLRAIASAASGVVLVWLTMLAWDFFRYVLRVWKESPTLYIPTFWYEGVVFPSICLILLFTVRELLEYRKLFKTTPHDAVIDKADGVVVDQ